MISISNCIIKINSSFCNILNIKNNILIVGGTGFIGYHLAKKSLKYGYDEILKRHPDSNTTNLNGAIVVLESKSGDILALVGGIDYKKSHFNRATQSKRQPGSAFKPFIYQKALNVGYSTLSEIPDISRVYVDKKSDKEWKPKKKNIPGKWLKRYSLLVSNAANGAVLKTEL